MYVTIEHYSPKAYRLLACSVPARFRGEEGKGKGREKGNEEKGNDEDGNEGTRFNGNKGRRGEERGRGYRKGEGG